jgi:cytochrome c5
MATPDVPLNPLAAQGRTLLESCCASCHSLQEDARPLVSAAGEVRRQRGVAAHADRASGEARRFLNKAIDILREGGQAR